MNAGTYTFAARAAGAGAAAIPLSALTVTAGASVVVKTATATTDRWALVLTTLVDGGTIDLGWNDMIVHGGVLSTLTALVTSGYAGGAWTGTGIDSSVAAGDNLRLRAVGIAPDTTASGSILTTTFDEQTVVATDVLIRSTLYGDANLDGAVNVGDYTLIDAGFISSGKLAGWANGDFNYDGAIDGSDYATIDNAFNMQAAVQTADVAVAAPAAAVAATVATRSPARTASNLVVAAAFRPASPFAGSQPNTTSTPSEATDLIDRLRRHAGHGDVPITGGRHRSSRNDNHRADRAGVASVSPAAPWCGGGGARRSRPFHSRSPR